MTIQIPSGFMPMVQGYSLKGPGGVKRIEVAGGMPRYGLSWDQGAGQYNVAIIMTDVKFQVWSMFYHLIIKKGSIAFNMPLDSGQGVQDHTCNIIPDSYMATRIDGRATTVTFAVDATPTVYQITSADAQIIIDFWNIYGDDSSRLLARIAAGLLPTVQAYSLKGPGGVRQTEVAGGLPRYGLEWDQGAGQYNVAMIMTAAKFAVWSAFYHMIIKKGSFAFTMPLDSGQGVQDHTCNIIPDSYTANRIDALVTTVTFAIDAIPNVYQILVVDAQSQIDFWNVYGDDGAQLLKRIAKFATVDSNVLQS